MYHTWNIYQNVLCQPAATIKARTKAEAEEIAFARYGHPMLVDLERAV